ncbi:protein BASIC PENTACYSTEINE5-like isoform X2 [Arachis ipaensis]|uniref:protein BASIC PENTACYSTEINE5-like isoform X2 n=1 Tax=Arachis ipaensis TaxID=130454 RepID=UPI0007AF424C|nr:protein BASIC PENTACYSTEINE5-like isoform X2 [Arachis ipaensis]
MDSSQHENGRHNMDYYRGAHSLHRVKEPNALVMNKKIRSIMAERQAAILVLELEAAISEKNEALAARDLALRQRDEALAQRDNALKERDNALTALKSQNIFKSGDGVQRGSKRMRQTACSPKDISRRDVSPMTAKVSEAVKSNQAKRMQDKNVINSKVSKPHSKAKKMGEDLNRQAASEGIKFKSEWDMQDVGLNLVAFDETIMPVPICTCTGVPRQCYKWGNGGWQSSCCTTTLSVYPLPQLPNKRHARIGGRKMSGSVFTRLLSRFALQGHDLSTPLDLKNYWARHGTNRKNTSQGCRLGMQGVITT